MSQPAEVSPRILRLALDVLRNTKLGDLSKALRLIADFDSTTLPADPSRAIVDRLSTCGPNDEVRHELTLAIQAWDHETSPSWSHGTDPHTERRRSIILGLLGFASEHKEIINLKILRFSASEMPIVIAESHTPWYEGRKPNIRDFYWRHYVDQLAKPKGNWDSDAIGQLEASVNDVVSRLSDPTQPKIYAVKGLVMGYVQSGKTSHFSGLIAKASDAGYRLIIVLAGTLDILRRQTQRRIDKEIVGRELLEGHDEYGADSDWATFVSHGGRPSENGHFDWERLTNSQKDYLTLSHLSLLDFKRADATKAFNDPDNLRSATARLVVIKKVPSRLNKLCADLQRLDKLRRTLDQVPTLVIDDESDQASVNTIDQTKPGKEGKRTTTNAAIGRLLEVLPRAQYVGYTATPFANFFINPEDAEDLFPKDFIVSLPRPSDYMGASDFYDVNQAFVESDLRGNQNALVRSVEGPNEEPDNLPKAIDSFILAGALKLFREAKDPLQFKFQHHTMLIHHSSKLVVHDEDRRVVETIFGGGARYHSQDGLRALQTLFASDFVPVSKVRAPDMPFPSDFDELRPYISQCVSRVCGGIPVRVVNGDDKNQDDTPDFQQTAVWAILLGGAKLSRGYTVEGLTVSYYRRPTGAGDTLMQMGRWFGFRPGYRDLVRLFIGRKEPKGKVMIDLYEAFGAVCRDEEALRADLLKYAEGGGVPRQVPPLVRQHLPQLPPTSKNKMFNAEIRSRNFAGDYTEKASATSQDKEMTANLREAAALLDQCRFSKQLDVAFDGIYSFSAYIGEAMGPAVLAFIRNYKWGSGKRPMALECDYIEAMQTRGSFDHWQLVLPQTKNRKTTERIAKKLGPLTIIERARVSANRFGVYSDKEHREAAAYLSGVREVRNPTIEFSKAKSGPKPVMLMYFVKAKDVPESIVTVGFCIQYPGTKTDHGITWMVRDKANEDAVVIQSSQKAASQKRRR